MNGQLVKSSLELSQDHLAQTLVDLSVKGQRWLQSPRFTILLGLWGGLRSDEHQ